ncbi:Sodium/hydrogen exchanger family-domain-containing protein, partial [Halteromyces radiatus]|uniref:Sodium/hydrogen exchanger family-domain-containing protein n=1 Tax=Halteromyces radiatus TaxID=101107 RepID=UPI00221F8BEC
SRLVPQDAASLYTILENGQRYGEALAQRKERLYNDLQHVQDSDTTSHLYHLVGVQLDDFHAFESLVYGMLKVYANTVEETSTNSTKSSQQQQRLYDYRTAALRLTYDFQLAIKASHDQLRSTPWSQLKAWATTEEENKDNGKAGSKEYAPHHQHQSDDIVTQGESMKDILHSMLQEVSDNADLLEKEMHQHHSQFTNGHLETVFKVEDEIPSIVTLIDQDQNEYIMTRPFDTTIIYEDMQFLHDVILILVISFAFGMLFSFIGLPVTILFFMMMGLVLGTSIKEAIFVGACVSLSSTAVVVKVIPLEHLDHLYGLLVMQDVLLGFMLAIVPALAKSGIQVAKAVLSVSMSFLLFATVCYGLVRIMIPSIPRLVHRFLPAHIVILLHGNMTHYHHELWLLGSLAVCLIMSLVSERLGLGMELGCFAAVVVPSSENNIHESLLSVVSPVRDLFACLFFASIGLHIYPSFLASELILLLILTTMVMGFKYLVTMSVLFSFKFDMHTCSTMSVALSQISEFVFVLASRAKQLQIISREVYYLLLAVTSLTLIATPLLWKLTHGHQHPHRRHQQQHHHHHHKPLYHDEDIELHDADKFA